MSGLCRPWEPSTRVISTSVSPAHTHPALAPYLKLISSSPSVSRSLESSPLTVLSIFVNPSQFAPTEDLATYPRTLPSDLAQLESLLSSHPKTASAFSTATSEADKPSPLVVFTPSVKEMYPNGITPVVAAQRGAFVEVKGFGDVMCVCSSYVYLLLSIMSPR